MPGAGAGRDAELVRRALALAERGRGRVEPNPLVGAVIARDGEVVGEGWHAEYGEAHAEVAALAAAGDSARGATAYVTLEPCSHHGKTPPCTDALLRAGVARVVFAASDPNPKARGGAALLRAAGVEVVSGVEEQAARDLNGRFFHLFAEAAATRPWVELKLAMSLDARLADVGGRSKWITGPGARAEVQRMRAGHDAIAVGIETAIADDPELTVRGEIQPRRPPTRVVFDRQLRLSPDSRLVRTARDTPVCVVHAPDASADRRAALEASGVRTVAAGDLAEGLGALREAGVASLLCEGGAGVASALLAADLVDRLSLFYAPVLLGPGGRAGFGGLPDLPLESARRWRRIRTEAFGADSLLVLGR